MVYVEIDKVIDFAGRLLKPNPNAVAEHMSTSACSGLMPGCWAFMTQDLATYEEMGRFLTAVSQGITAYEQIAKACVADYVNGDRASAQGVADRVNKAADPTLDDMAAEYEAKRPPAPWVAPSSIPPNEPGMRNYRPEAPILNEGAHG